MEKTIQNIKKILHIGPKKVKHEESKSFYTVEPKVAEKVVTTVVELKKENITGAEDFLPIVHRGWDNHSSIMIPHSPFLSVNISAYYKIIL